MAWKMKLDKNGHPRWFSWDRGDIEVDPEKEFKMDLVYKKDLYPDLVTKSLFLIPNGSTGEENGVYRVLPKEVKEIKPILKSNGNKISGIFRWIKRGENFGLKPIKIFKNRGVEE